MENTKKEKTLAYKEELLTDRLYSNISRKVWEQKDHLLGKLFTFIETFTEDEKVSKARKDIVASILQEDFKNLMENIGYRVEWFDYSLYGKDTLKDNYRHQQKNIEMVSSEVDDYINCLMPNKDIDN